MIKKTDTQSLIVANDEVLGEKKLEIYEDRNCSKKDLKIMEAMVSLVRKWQVKKERYSTSRYR